MLSSEHENFIRSLLDCRSAELGSYPTERAIQKILSWTENEDAVDYNRPSWSETYLSMAHTLAHRSHDSQTQHGCIIVSKDMKPLSWGYNGFISGIWDDILPNTRPEKYPWMLHAEINAIMNATSSLKDSIVFLTGHPCTQCYMFMCASGISEIIYSTTKSECVEGNEEELARFEVIRWLTHNRIKMTPHKTE